MRVVNGWLIADKSKYSNFVRVRLSDIEAYVYYTTKDPAHQDQGNFIRVFTRGKDHDIYFENSEVLMNFQQLEKIMWEFDNEVTIK